ncbi:MAG: membrane protein insertase YidC [Alphaproteobacteria bacterium RIFCSPLOWO2_01_FULL_40_26]|nr:MAG: membrane protein insertase YidC [Alphaproteobacteria bacterium RIFCSPHIGHO2_02_FULL_40_34]OFW86629.1 MAG: membrane protein insertase YidC [Alphaproteobacteria bacterium RIFCSPHIGHO2_01_FULL_40_8]OFW94510.1 MAG: membrane protein insertase YidC [Alphaproteobacteria bacterium RIFCSPLOWO2_01_FULL_40_26]OFX10218.1 MAG: membrane protein insertase YidC [Alphaproteobacteria bacterium RIFCSPLOWO2_02_FULL_40_19]OFX11301.1 MAG: membrane protein insertase YidC [Alphaproteobacteria bacterium RIFCSPL
MQQNNGNILIATILSVVVLLSWTWFVEKPKIEKKQHEVGSKKQEIVGKKQEAEDGKEKQELAKQQQTNVLTLKHRDEILSSSKESRVGIESDSLHGSISLKGARFDDLTLAKYFDNVENKKEVALFAPAESKERYFADFGWISSDSGLEMPNPNTFWKSDSKKLTPQNPVILSWKNKQNVEFFIKISLDENYVFAITQLVKNSAKNDISIASYGRINRVLNNLKQSVYILHEGPIGTFGGILQEISYKDLIKDKIKKFSDGSEDGSWLGITDKYWLSALIPDRSISYDANFSYDQNNQNNFFGSEFVGQEFKIAAGEELKFEHHLFAGAKRVRLLDQYAKNFDLKLFDRAIDFGWFYFLTKPFFFIIEFLNKFLGNFGLAILAMTVLIKLALFPMANKSYAAIAKMKKLQPKIEALRARFKDDKIAMNREMMELYKREKINPASGCLPILIQIPIFFALYKVLYVTLDMRHAPFYGWIHDLSAPDPTSIFNLFGLLPFEVSSAFTIGIWPILMGITMIIQQKLSPASTDPTQAAILKWMPYVLTFVLAAFPAGLVIYWTWSNTLSVLQQWVITKKLNESN